MAPCVPAWQANHNRVRRAGRTAQGTCGIAGADWLGQGNPTIALANALDAVLDRGRREERKLGSRLGKTPLFLVFKTDVDYTLGLGLRQRIVNRGPFEVLEPKRDLQAVERYEDLSRARAALLCWGKAGKSWINHELDALNRAAAISQLYGVRRAIYMKSSKPADNIDLFEGDRILQSDAELDSFLSELRPSSEGAEA